MQGQEYLNQISASNRQVQKSGNKILSSKFFIVGAIGAILLVLILIIGAILNAGKGGEEESSYALILHVNSTVEEIQEFQTNIKSSTLRSDAGSLQGVLSNTSTKLTTYLEGKYNYKESNISSSLTAEAEANKAVLHNELFEAKINGILDRIFAHKMVYEISLFLTEEGKLLKMTNDEDLTTILSTSYKSLENLKTNFEDFSEGK
jgi:hypothetical protein